MDSELQIYLNKHGFHDTDRLQAIDTHLDGREAGGIRIFNYILCVCICVLNNRFLIWFLCTRIIYSTLHSYKWSTQLGCWGTVWYFAWVQLLILGIMTILMYICSNIITLLLHEMERWTFDFRLLFLFLGFKITSKAN